MRSYQHEQAAQAKREKEAIKKALRRERKAFWTTCKAQNYYSGGEGEVAGRMQELEGLCDYLSMEQLRELNGRLSSVSSEEGKSVVEEAVREG